MKKIFVILLGIILLFTSCRIVDSDVDDIKNNNTDIIDNKEPNEPVVKEKVNITYYFDEDNTYSVEEKYDKVILPEYVFAKGDVEYTSKFDFIDLKELSKLALINDETNLTKIPQRYANGYLFFGVDWFLDEEFTKPATASFSDDTILYAKPMELSLIRYSSGEVLGQVKLNERVPFISPIFLRDDSEYIFKNSIKVISYEGLPEYPGTTNFPCTEKTNIPTIYNQSLYNNPKDPHHASSWHNHFDYIKAKKIIVEDKVFTYFKGLLVTDNVVIKCKDISNNNNIEEIVIEGNVDTIYNGAFYNLSNLKKITFTGAIKTIYHWAFSDLPALEEINFVSVEELNADYLDNVNENVKINYLN